MPKQYACLSEVTVGAGGTSAINFTSIPQTYTDLIVKISARSTLNAGAGNDYVKLNFNGVTGSKTYIRLYGGNASVGTDSGSLALAGVIPGQLTTSNTFSSMEFYIPNYTGSTNKSSSIDSVSVPNSLTDYELDLIALLWSNTAAITEINLTASFAQYSTATLYGITKS